MSIMRAFIAANVTASKWFDKTFLPPSYITDGNNDFVENVVPAHLLHGMKIYDVGGGKRPYLAVERKASLSAYVVGVDISQHELDCAPAGAYDETICADISQLKGSGDGDLVICQAVLEHVRDTEGAKRSIASLLKPGGKALIFVPSRNAVFARLNLILPQQLKRWILYTIYPSKRYAQGFPSFYHRCTPSEFVAMAASNGLDKVHAHYYYTSSYFSFLFPLYVLWRAWVVLFKAFAGYQASETFSLVFVKK